MFNSIRNRKRPFSFLLFFIVFLSLFTFTVDKNVLAATTCYTQEQGSVRGLESCPASGGKGSTAVVYKDVKGKVISQPGNGKCYLGVTDPQTGAIFSETDCSTLTQAAQQNSGSPNTIVLNPFLKSGENDSCGTGDSNCIVKDILIFINVLSVGVGVVVVIMIIWGGIQYTASRANPQSVQAAKSRIINALFALVAYLFIYAFLQWIVPGGIFN